MDQVAQNELLELLRTQAAEVNVYLMNGLKLVGRIEAHDQYGLVLERGGMHQFVYKHAISTVTLSVDPPPGPGESPPPARKATLSRRARRPASPDLDES